MLTVDVKLFFRLLAFFEVIHAGPLDCTDVNKHISGAVVGLNEAKALFAD
jgi:hypothetical protein